MYAHAYLNALYKYTLFVHFIDIFYVHFINKPYLYTYICETDAKTYF